MDQIIELRLKLKVAKYRYRTLRVKIEIIIDDVDALHILGSVLMRGYKGQERIREIIVS